MSIARIKSSHEEKEEYFKSILYYLYIICTTNQVTILALFYRIKENIKPVLLS